MAQVMTFPKELERNVFRDMDKGFILTWLITSLIFYSVMGYMQTMELKPLSAEKVLLYQQRIFRVQVEKPKAFEAVSDVTTGGAEIPVDVGEEEEAGEEAPVQLTAEEKAAAREAKKAARSAKAEARRQAIAQRLKVLAGPTARGRHSRRGRSAASAAIGLSEGGMGGADLKGALAIVGGAADAAKVKKLRGGGAIAGDIGSIDIGDLRGFLADPANLQAMLSEATVKLSRKAITTKGKGSKRAQRSQAAISQKVMENKNQVQYCYWTAKRRDSSLKGQIVVEFVIAPSGKVIKVRFRRSEWGRNPLQKDIERCIKNIIMQWRFEPIPESDGNVTAGATYFFE